MRMSLADRVAQLEERGEQLAAQRQAGITRAGTEPSEVHKRLVGVLVDVLEMVGTTRGEGVPMPLLVAARALRSMKDELLDSLADVPAAEVRKVLVAISHKLEEILDEEDGPRTDQPAA